jgi:division protein CdvB (Snf7/Vps24/ESCRT-III family)
MIDVEKASTVLQRELLILMPVQTKLANLEKEMQGQIVIDSFRGDKTHANMLANELVVIRRVSKLASDLRIVYETLILRIGTMRDYNELLNAIKPTVTILKGVQKDLAHFMPKAKETFARIPDLFTSTLVTLNLVNKPVPAKATGDALEILEEASRVAEEQLKRKFPTLPQITADSKVPVEV